MAANSIERKYATLAIDDIDEDGTFSGYASLFGQVDLGRDRVEHGAFLRSLTKRGIAGVRMLYQHDPTVPIGRWHEIREDERGLFVKGRLTKSASRSREVLELMRGGALDGLSIGFRTVRSRTEAKTGIRRIIEADLWEISIVTFPMLPGARVETVKSAASMHAIPTKREFERWLTRDAELTRGQARAFVAKGYAGLMCERDAARHPSNSLTEAIHRASKLFK